MILTEIKHRTLWKRTFPFCTPSTTGWGYNVQKQFWRWPWCISNQIERSIEHYASMRNDDRLGCVNGVSKGAKIRNRYNPVPHLTQHTNGKVTNSQPDNINESQEVSPFPAGVHKAHINRRAQRHSNWKTEKQKIHKRSTTLVRSVKYFTGGLKLVSQCASLTLNSDVDQDT